MYKSAVQLPLPPQKKKLTYFYLRRDMGEYEGEMVWGVG